MEVTGILKAKFDTQKVSDRFQKREFVLTTESTTPYPQHVSFQLTQDKCGEIDAHNVGDEIRVQFNLQGREWNGPQGLKYFNTLDAWKIQKGGATSSAPKNSSSTATNVEQPTSMSSNSNNSYDNDDAPF
jgi:hypothetical protein